MRILIIGLGSIARKHICAIRNIDPEAIIYALRSGEGHADVDGVENIYDLEKISYNFDFALISNPTSKHAETLEQLLKKKIPIFIEKPIFSDLGHKELINKIKSSGIITYVACNLRFLDSLRFLHDYVRSHTERRINEVNVYCGSYLPEWRPDTDYKQCYSAIPELGGGVHIDLIHEIDYVYWIFGKPLDSFGFFRSKSTLDIRSVDYANYVLEYPQFVASVVLNYYRKDYKRTLEILFEDETWVVDLSKNTIVNHLGEIIFKGENTPLQTYEAQMNYFFSILKNNMIAENDIETAYDILKICLENERSEK